MRRTILFLFFAACLSAKEPVKIVEILDTNLFVTHSGDTLSMAFIETVSMHTADSSEQKLANQIMKYLERLCKSDKIFVNTDSTRSYQGELSIKLPFGYESLNQKMLQKGYATVTDKSTAPAFYIQAENAALRSPTGIHKVIVEREKIYYQHAWWMNAGLGLGVEKIKGRNGGASLLALGAGLNIRYKHWLITGDYIRSGRCCHDQFSWFGSIGYSFHAEHSEAAISIGPSWYKYKYNTEYMGDDPNFPRIIKSDLYSGVAVKMQTLFYVKQAFGLGLNLTLIFLEDHRYYFLTLNLILGGWWN